MPDDGFDPDNHEWPENDKLALVIEERDAILQFVEWMEAKGIEFCAIPDFFDHTHLPVLTSIERYVYEFLSIDEGKLEEERRAMLASLRASH